MMSGHYRYALPCSKENAHIPPLFFTPFEGHFCLPGQAVQFVRQNRNLGMTHLRSSAHSDAGLVSDIAASQWPVPRVGVKTPGY